MSDLPSDSRYMDLITQLNLIEKWVARIGGLAALVTLGAIFHGIWVGLRREAGRKTGRMTELLREPAFYGLASAGYFGLCYRLWRPIPLTLPALARLMALAFGALLYFPGLALILWGRLALGRMYFVSSSLGAQLYAKHRLVIRGPYALVRHPMYLGILLTGLGGILIYRTWPFVFVALTFLGLVRRANREEEALRAEFGGGWEEYCRRVSRWIPRLKK